MTARERKRLCKYNYDKLESVRRAVRKYENLRWAFRQGEGRCKHSFYEIMRKFYRYAEGMHILTYDGENPVVTLSSSYMNHTWGGTKNHTYMVYASLVGLVGRLDTRNSMSNYMMIYDRIMWNIEKGYGRSVSDMAAWIVYKLDEERLMEIDEMIREYRDQGITPLFVNSAVLLKNGLTEEAAAVLPEHRAKQEQYDVKLGIFKRMSEDFDRQISEKGYADKRITKEKLKKEGIPGGTFDAVFRLFVRSGEAGYDYKKLPSGHPDRETVGSRWVIS